MKLNPVITHDFRQAVTKVPEGEIISIDTSGLPSDSDGTALSLLAQLCMFKMGSTHGFTPYPKND